MGYQEGPDVPPPSAPPPPAPSGYQAPGGTYGGRPQRTNGFAIASLIFGIIGGVLFGLIFGYIALSQIKRSGGTQGGRGMAQAGVILSWAWLAIVVIVIASQRGS